MGWPDQVRKGTLELLALAVLEHGETYGYELLKALNGGATLSFTESALYLALGRLHKAGLVRSQKRPSELGPPRRYYALTDAGRAELESMRTYWSAIARDIRLIAQLHEEAE